MISDVLAGINAGCKGSFIVETGKVLTEDEARSRGLSRGAGPVGRRPIVILGSTDDLETTSRGVTP